MVGQARRAGADGDAAEQLPRLRRGGGGEVPGVRRAHARPPRPSARHDHGGPRGGRRDLRRHRRRRVCSRTATSPARCASSRTTASAADDALGAASWRAREWLGLDGALSEGTTADFVVYDRDPLEDLAVLANPKRIVLRGPGRWLTPTRASSTRCVPRAACSPRRRPRCCRREARTRWRPRAHGGAPRGRGAAGADRSAGRSSAGCGSRSRRVCSSRAGAPRSWSSSPSRSLPSTAAPVVVDLCCGTGAIGVAVAAARTRTWSCTPPTSTPTRSPVPGSTSPMGQVHEGDLYDALPARPRGRVDLLAGERAVRAHRRDRADAVRGARCTSTMSPWTEEPTASRSTAGWRPVRSEWLRPGGTLLIETSRHQADDTRSAAARPGLRAGGRRARRAGDGRRTSDFGAGRVVWHNDWLSRTPFRTLSSGLRTPTGFHRTWPHRVARGPPLHTRKETPHTWPSRFV